MRPPIRRTRIETAPIPLTSSSPASWTPNTSSTWQTTTTNWNPTNASLRMANVSSSRAICSDPLTSSLSRSINLHHLQLMYAPPPNWHSDSPRSHHLLPTMSNGEAERRAVLRTSAYRTTSNSVSYGFNATFTVTPPFAGIDVTGVTDRKSVV